MNIGSSFEDLDWRNATVKSIRVWTHVREINQFEKSTYEKSTNNRTHLSCHGEKITPKLSECDK